ncbi:MAG: hypothetical protein R6U98_31705 [Pirellulaceae bacterium]
MESCPAPAALPLVGLAAEKLIRDRYRMHRVSDVEWNHHRVGRRRDGWGGMVWLAQRVIESTLRIGQIAPKLQ